MPKSDVELVVEAARSQLGEPETWGAPVEFLDSLALCALNSSFSLRNKSSSVRAVLARYRALRPTADTDSGPDLLRAMGEAGGPENFAVNVLGSRKCLPGTSRLCTVGIYEGLENLQAIGVVTAADLRELAGVRETKRAWTRVKGIGRMGWSYLIMNAGVSSETKPDVMLESFVSRAVGSETRVGSARTSRAVREAAKVLGVEVRALDRAIWLHESPYG